jgi:hypothetical protein
MILSEGSIDLTTFVGGTFLTTQELRYIDTIHLFPIDTTNRTLTRSHGICVAIGNSTILKDLLVMVYATKILKFHLKNDIGAILLNGNLCSKIYRMGHVITSPVLVAALPELPTSTNPANHEQFIFCWENIVPPPVHVLLTVSDVRHRIKSQNIVVNPQFETSIHCEFNVQRSTNLKLQRIITHDHYRLSDYAPPPEASDLHISESGNAH